MINALKSAKSNLCYYSSPTKWIKTTIIHRIIKGISNLAKIPNKSKKILRIHYIR